MTDIKRPPVTEPQGGWSTYVLLTMLYGCVQGILAIPVLYGFAALVFSSPVYAPFMPSIAKVFMCSSAVHAAAVAALSTLPYAIGQVQDAGLLFFCRMATDIAARMSGAPPEAVAATALVAIATSTVLVGLSLICIGKMRLANLVAYVPMPVFGGYLAFIGLFCIEAGLSLTSGEGINGLGTWYLLVQSKQTVILVVTALFTGGCLCWVARNLDTMVLPACICVIPGLFYATLYFTNTSMDDARKHGWLGQEHTPGHWENVFEMYDFSLVDWSVLPYQLPCLVTMIIVITFGSTMDVAAVEMGTGVPMNADEQLVTIGLSNVIAGSAGGFAGSYIFTQTLLGFKSKFRYRSVGFVLAGLQFAIFLCSFDPLCSIPLFFFASTIIFIGIDLLLEWVWEVRSKLALGEYLVLLATFAAVVAFGMDMGFVLGVVAATVNFVCEYTLSTRDNSSRYVVNITSRMRSMHLRKPGHERTLKQHFGAIRTLELHGSIFFGSAAGVLSDIVDACAINIKLPMGNSYGSMASLSVSGADARTRSVSESAPLLSPEGSDSPIDIESAAGADMGSDASGEKKNALRFLVLDCRNLKGVDATAARRCFCELHRFAERQGISIVFAGCAENVLNIIESHGAISLPWTRHIDNIYDALNYCETTLLAEIAIDKDKLGALSFAKKMNDGVAYNEESTALAAEPHEFKPLTHRSLTLRMLKRFTVSEIFQIFFEFSDKEKTLIDQYSSHYEEIDLQADTLLFALMDDPDCFYIILEGEVQTYLVDSSTPSNRGTILHPGACVGYTDYMLHQPRSFFAKAAVSPTVVACFTRRKMEALIEEKSFFAMCMLQLVCKQSSLELQNVYI